MQDVYAAAAHAETDADFEAARPRDSLNRNRFRDKIMQHFKVLQRPLRVRSDARRDRAGLSRGQRDRGVRAAFTATARLRIK
ncbi:hypothetical protein EHS39_00230 [Ensifer sp. MPMI2T]|nr:hypothetical protein EHS39_00230 [Ensifer sp. MPMI2T]